MNAPLDPGYTLRPPRRDDAHAIVALAVACDIAEYGAPDFTGEDLEADWAAPRFTLERDAWVIESPAGRLSGYADLWDREPGREFRASLYVHPEDWDIGTGPRLLAAAEARTRGKLREAGTDAARLAAVVPSVNHRKQALLKAAGYRLTRTYYRMDIDLRERDPRPAPVSGLEIRAFRPGVDDAAAHLAIDESFADHFGHVHETIEDWKQLRMGDPRYNPELWHIAWDGDEVAGAILGYDMGDISWIRELGVRAAWRGRGLGRALLLHSFAQFRARGRMKVSLGVDSRNAYDATGLYERAGMVVGQQHDFWEREITA
jgi:ribosomal protein S18 acetylase RimI-like enzyme